MSFPRYAKYKDSGVAWLGEVPAHWGVCAVRRAVDRIEQGWSPECEATPADDDTWGVLKAGCLNNGFFDASENKTLPPGLAPMPEYEVCSGDVLMSRASGSPELVGSVALVKETRPKLMLSDKIFRIRLATEISPAHFVWMMSSRPTRSQIEQALSGGNGLANNLPQSVLLAFQLAVPPRQEQDAIASFLDRETAKIDALVAEQEQLITLLKEKRQAVISHAVTKGLDPAHWGVSPLKFLARIGNGSTPNRDNPNYWAEDGFPWLNSSVVNQSEVSEAERFVTETALKECHLPIIEPPAVLVGITGQGKTRGMAAPLAFTATVNQHLAYIKPDQDRLHVGFLLCALEAAYEHLRTESEGVGSTKGAITCGQLGAWCLPAPALDVQAEIVSFLGYELNKLDELTAQAETAIGLLTERRSALISAAVTGQIDVRGLAPQEAA